MPFVKSSGRSFNCGFCRTLVYECLPKRSAGTSEEKESKSKTEKVESNIIERFQSLFVGPQFVIGPNYFVKKSLKSISLFKSHCKMIEKAFAKGFISSTFKENYVKAFSSFNWSELSSSEKERHSLSNCVACAMQFPEIQKTFPLKPFFEISDYEKENASKETYNGKKQNFAKPLSEHSRNRCYSKGDVNKLVKEAQKELILEFKGILDSSTLQAVYSNNISLSKADSFRKEQFFEPPTDDKAPKKKRYPLRPHECSKFPELYECLKTWDTNTKFIASDIAKLFDVNATDGSNKIRLLAQEINPSIPGLEIVPKPKSTKKRFRSTSMAVPIPPNKRRLVDIDCSLVQSGM